MFSIGMSKNCNPLNRSEFDDSQSHGDSRSVLIVKDKGQQHLRIENDSKHYILKLRLIEDNLNKKCDYLILDCSDENAYFVELKGQNLSEAVKQIVSTISVLATRLTSFNFHCRIVQTKVIGAIQQIHKEKLARYLKEKHKANLKGKMSEIVKIGSEQLIDKI
jgi:hypothetical protein